MKASDLFVKALENEGVEYIFGIPGEENLDLLESLRHSNIKLVVTRHEQAAGFMAATFGRLTGKPGVALSTLGPGATNLLTSTAYAQLGAMPVVFLTGQKSLGNRRQAAFQIIDVVDMMRPITKFTEQITNASSIPFKIREAFRIAQHETPGATHLELPENVAAEEVDEKVIARRNHRDIGFASESEITEVVELIKKAKHPLIMIGANAKREKTCEAITKLVETTGIPFFTTQMGKGVVNEFSDHFLGTAALSSGDYIHQAIEEADLILNIGHDIVEKPPFVTNAEKYTVVHLNYHPASIVEVYQPQRELIGDIAYSVKELARQISPGHWDFSPFEKVKTKQREKVWEEKVEVNFPIKPQHLVRTVQEVMPKDGSLAFDNGMYKIWFARNYRANHPNAILLDNALASMGAGLPSAIAAQILYPDKKVMAICGDGGFMMNSAELETAVRLKLNFTVMIVNDNALGMIRWKQKEMGFGNYGLSLDNPDFVKYAESYGAHGVRVTSGEELQETLRHCLESDGVHLVEVPIDYSENQKVFG